MKSCQDVSLLRYGVISTEHAIADLERWESLLFSGMMLRPHFVQVSNDRIAEAQKKNLRSALAYAALMCSAGADEKDLYQSIADLPVSHCKLFIVSLAQTNGLDFGRQIKLTRPISPPIVNSINQAGKNLQKHAR